MVFKHEVLVLKSNEQTAGLLSIKKSNGCWQEGVYWDGGQTVTEGARPSTLKSWTEEYTDHTFKWLMILLDFCITSTPAWKMLRLGWQFEVVS